MFAGELLCLLARFYEGQNPWHTQYYLEENDKQTFFQYRIKKTNCLD
jgi:hypothetical protein